MMMTVQLKPRQWWSVKLAGASTSQIVGDVLGKKCRRRETIRKTSHRSKHFCLTLKGGVGGIHLELELHTKTEQGKLPTDPNTFA